MKCYTHEDADGDGVPDYSIWGWILDPGDVNGIDDDNYADNFVGWDVSFNDNDPMPASQPICIMGQMFAYCVSTSTNNGTGIDGNKFYR